MLLLTEKAKNFQRPSFQTQYDKITQAYIRGKIRPMNPEECYCGTIAPDATWINEMPPTRHPYTHAEYKRMEHAFFQGIRALNSDDALNNYDCIYFPTEDQLFNGMVCGLNEMKRIHQQGGETVDMPDFLKRENASPMTYAMPIPRDGTFWGNGYINSLSPRKVRRRDLRDIMAAF